MSCENRINFGDHVSELKQRFHFAKLILSQTRYLYELSNKIQQEPNSPASELYNQAMISNGHSVIPNPINQAVFLQMAYVSLVWLSEALTPEQRGNIRKQFTNEDFKSAKLSNCTNSANINCYFRHLRNALAHASVDLSDDVSIGFRFSGRNGETLCLSGEDLGRISEKWILLVSNVLYPSDVQQGR